MMRTSSAVDDHPAIIGVVVHGPEVVDTGYALRALDWLASYGEVHAVLGGTMGRVAVIDAGLEERIDISRRRTPSQSLQDLQNTKLTVLLNYAKSRETGLAFGAQVVARARPKNTVLQADYGGRFVTTLANPSEFGEHLKSEFSDSFGLEIIESRLLEKRDKLRLEGDLIIRKVSGVLPGEKVSVNGTVIGTATDGDVEIVARAGRIIGAKGLEIKNHGLEKIPSVDLRTAIVRSGDIRRTAGMLPPRVSSRIIFSRDNKGFTIIDHAAEESFERAADAPFVVTVGDDTTAIAGGILARLGIPIVGIVDGDPDCICRDHAVPSGSIIVKVEAGHDDIIGRALAARAETRRPSCPDDVLELIQEVAGDRVLSVSRFDRAIEIDKASGP